MTSAVSSTDPTQTAAAASTAAAAATTPGGALGQDAFLKMLVAQLKNQDPLNPLQGDQMASELAQFSSLQQLTNINQTLTGQSASQGQLLGALQSGAAIGTIGHTVVAMGNQIALGTGGSTSVTANVSGGGGTGTLHIYDDSGTEVGSRSLGQLPGGTQTIALGSAANGLPPGHYTYAINVKDSAGNAVSVQTYMTGRVDGVRTGASGLTLTAGSLTIPYAAVTQIIN